MAAFRLRIPHAIHQELFTRARAARPLECCGILAGTVENGLGTVREHYPLVNERQSPVEYVAEARGLFDAMRAMRANGTDVLAVYHSHPASAPVPSRTDLERNYSEDVVNLIIGFDGPVPELRAWWLRADDYREAEWERIEPPD